MPQWPREHSPGDFCGHADKPLSAAGRSVADGAALATDQAALAAVDEVKSARLEILREIEKRIIGQHQVIDQLLVSPVRPRGHRLSSACPASG